MYVYIVGREGVKLPNDGIRGVGGRNSSPSLRPCQS